MTALHDTIAQSEIAGKEEVLSDANARNGVSGDAKSAATTITTCTLPWRAGDLISVPEKNPAYRWWTPRRPALLYEKWRVTGIADANTLNVQRERPTGWPRVIRRAPWFAWRPVRTEHDRIWRWLCTLERKTWAHRAGDWMFETRSYALLP